jgi:hypothetical protein
MAVPKSNITEGQSSARFTSEDIHRAFFPKARPKRRTIREIKAGLAKYIQERHPRR